MDDDEIQLNFGGIAPTADITTLGFATEFDAHYGLLQPAQTVLVRAYSDDSDDRVLDELKPRFIVMFEPCMEFVRRVEVSYFCFLSLLVHIGLCVGTLGLQVFQSWVGGKSIPHGVFQFL